MNATDQIAQNLASIRGRIEEAARRSGRSADEVTLVAVTKYVDVDLTRQLINAGCRVLGESRPQQLWEKFAAIANEDVQWHLIGHLQRNKIRRTLPCTSLIQSIDSEATLRSIDRIAGELSLVSHGLLEVNISGDSTKTGFSPTDARQLIDIAGELSHVRIQGLMAMASLAGGADTLRANFSGLRELRDQLRPTCPPTVSLDELSMGMSGDFEIAIEEGATMVRVGSALFTGID